MYKKWVIIWVILIGLLIIVGFLILNTQDTNKPRITEAQSIELAKKYYGDSEPGFELSKSADLIGGWCYSMMPTNGEEVTGGVTLCIDESGQGYEIVSFMPPPVQGQSIYDYTSALEREYSGWTKFKGQNRWDIKVDI